MPYVGNSPASNFASVTKDTFSGDGSTTAFTLSKAATTNGVAVFVENVRQEPTTAYAVSGTTLTFTAAPVSASGNNIYVLHHNAPASTATQPAGQDLTAANSTMTGTLAVTGTSTLTGNVALGGTLDMNGAELILDADGDTSITADTDDQIDFKVGGDDKMKILSGGSVGFGTTANFGGFGGSTSGLTFASAAPAYSLHETDVDKDAQFAMGGGIVYIYTADNINFKIHLNDTRRFEIMANGDAFYFDGTSGDGDINFYNNNLYLKSSSGEVYATDSAGNHTLLSPHNFKYLPDGKSETGAWAYLSEKTAPNKVTKTIENGKERSYTKEFYDNKREDGDDFTYVNVDMMKVVREVEKLTGTKLVYSGTNGKDDGSTVKDDIIAGLIKRIEALESK